MPAGVLDLDAVETNVDRLVQPVRAHGKSLRLASKSIRCVDILRHIMARAPDVIRGIMCYAAEEARCLFERGFDDLLLAYPTMQPCDLEALARLNRGGARVSVAVDCEEHIEALARAAHRADSEVPVILDVDASTRALGGTVHLGVRRSPISRTNEAVALARKIQATPGVSFHGVMVYEAQIAGVQDQSPYSPTLNPAKAALRRACRPSVEHLRRALREALESAEIPVHVFNGGGTGSLRWAVTEPALTEVTAGSGFFDPHLFDYYSGLELEPALFFALQITRRPAPGFVTCHGGGYVASGEAGPDRLPRPFLPEGLQLLKLEGAGEVQTPLRVPKGIGLGLGAPIFFRHAKAGELAEHFNEYLLCRGDQLVGRAKTYRGEGWRFL